MPRRTRQDPLPIASPECSIRLRAFETALAALCNQYCFDINSDAGIDISDREDRRTGSLKREWPYVAGFAGVDADGVYNCCNPQQKPQPGFDLNFYDLDTETSADLREAGLLLGGRKK
jgi:hypothetical protein